LGDGFLGAVFLKTTEEDQIFGMLVFTKSYVLSLTKNALGKILGKIFTNPSGHPGTDVTILKIFSPKNSAKQLAFLTQNKGKLCKILIITLVFEKIGENRRKL
jgi:hypothetical protein